MHCILRMKLWQVFDIDGLSWHGDFVVKACLIDLDAKPGPLSNVLDRIRNRKHMYGAMLSAGGTCANGIGGWRDSYISDILRYIDDFEPARDTHMIFGMYADHGSHFGNPRQKYNLFHTDNMFPDPPSMGTC